MTVTPVLPRKYVAGGLALRDAWVITRRDLAPLGAQPAR